MKPVSNEEYKLMQEKSWKWANDLIQKQIDDPRPGVQHLTNRAIINLKQMLESSHELYKDEIAFYTKFEKSFKYEEEFTNIIRKRWFNYKSRHFVIANCDFILNLWINFYKIIW